MSSTGAEILEELPGDEPNDVLFHSKHGVGLIELNRPKKLNTLNGSMARKITSKLLVSVSYQCLASQILTK
jgi:3-hydroxyisobutyryl-CoA hydrolase